jgi:hypothetical protein
MRRNSNMNTFQPMQHRSGTMRDRLHAYTKRTLGAGGSVSEAVWVSLFLKSLILFSCLQNKISPSPSVYPFSGNSSTQ